MKNGSVFVQSANRQVIGATACMFMQVCVASSNKKAVQGKHACMYMQMYVL